MKWWKKVSTFITERKWFKDCMKTVASTVWISLENFNGININLCRLKNVHCNSALFRLKLVIKINRIWFIKSWINGNRAYNRVWLIHAYVIKMSVKWYDFCDLLNHLHHHVSKWVQYVRPNKVQTACVVYPVNVVLFRKKFSRYVNIWPSIWYDT